MGGVRRVVLTAEDVEEAWAEYERGVLTEELAERYGVHTRTLWRRFREAGLRHAGGGRRHCRRPAKPEGHYDVNGPYGLLIEHWMKRR